MTKLHLNIDMWDSHSSSFPCLFPISRVVVFQFFYTNEKNLQTQKAPTGTNRDPPLCAPVPPPPVQVGSFSRGGFRVGEINVMVFRHVYQFTGEKKKHIPVLNHLYIYIFIFFLF